MSQLCLPKKLKICYEVEIFLFGHLQVPVAPLQRGDGTSVFPQSWNDETIQVGDNPSEKVIAAMITWTYGGTSVAVEGSWDSWTYR